MAKLIFVIAILVVTGCQTDEKKKTYQDFQTQGYGIMFGNGFFELQFNLQNDSLNAALPEFDIIYRDTMHLSVSEKNEIAASFFEQEIDKNFGEIEVNGKDFSSPRVADEIYIYRNKKKIASLNIVKSYEPEGLFPNGSEKRIIKFRDAAWKVLNNKSKYQIARDSLRSMLKKSQYIRL